MAGFVCEERLTYGPWQAMERMLARMIEHSGFKDVMIVGGSGDQGADIVGTLGNDRWVLQSKYRKYGSMESSAAKEVVKALAVYKATVAVAATNQAFSQDAFEYQNRSQEKRDRPAPMGWSISSSRLFWNSTKKF